MTSEAPDDHSGQEPVFAPDPHGPKRLTWLSKFLILLMIASPVIYVWSGTIEPQDPRADASVENPGIQPTTDYRVTPLFNRDYYYTLRRLFKQAKQRIIVAQYMIDAPSLGDLNWPSWREDRVKKLLEALNQAHKRSVNVTVVLSKPSPNNKEKNKVNETTKRWLEARGIAVGYNRSDRIRLHDKVVMVDRRWVVQGSHNWTIGPMTTNVEASLLMEAKDGEKWTWEDYHDRLSIGINETEKNTE